MLSTPVPRSPLLDEQSSSSLVARILARAEQRGDHENLHKLKTPDRGLPGSHGVMLWDELDMEQYSEQDLFLRSLSEAIADVSLSSARVQLACEQRELVLQHYLNQTALVHSSVLQIRLVPLRLLLPELRQFIQLFSVQQNQAVEFDVQGETVEVDQAVLDTLARPLLQLFQVCLADATVSIGSTELSQPARIWLHAQQVGNEVSLEIGFSMPVSGGALEGIREPLQRINGTFSLGRNAANGVSFYFRFPRAQGVAHCLLIRVGSERFVVPASQVQRVSDCQYEKLNMVYDAGTLLGLSSTNSSDQRIQPVLVLPTANSPMLIGVKVDEVIDDMELAMKPLPSYLQRPGIACSSIDGKGNVLLWLDLPELIRHYSLYGQKAPMPVREDATQPQRSGAATVLIADDSVSMRQSLRQMLTWAQYTILEARDGMVALEQLLEHVPDVLLLDIEMPNLNGYDLLRAMRSYPQLAHVKTVVLTSRSSEKHKGQARALGAHLYLTKPVVSEVLLATIKELLESS
jgi:chemosensory pili system protein ChpA (sensor histidine kinase/response regulator)